MVEQTFTVIDPLGIHARPATVLIQIANRYSSHINLEFNNKTANLKSIMGVMSLGIEKDDSFKLLIEGNDEQSAYDALEQTLHKEGLAQPAS
ncbi:phosphocarrier protein HPr [Radiobacillus sp. PE A8.2]|uniref:phosphocarrier protein HPr n=1 Tax=Radiobacillus sp. PE A8.2 TaxID=3380349 RepID=UPI00388EBFE7